ncbi:50S ribosomal protein L35 [candidate division WOR-1 bacterium RIFOXYA12_FULL_43_27]|uniref:Large ribosomal subunit protein bL35 n=1 Tax=candidate division WOR-1 bacterium RIFOXYC2_FULL_46_14 TaxID=1802587 RepID=A0A1F4U4T4_UNCSA|nr:MAG: 50S ribosomal protein L35 [candidate division WOR-1 bacterium RIFOXYA12_FULL_43_27]OGC20724.1 MAG: 50S ribosomal protein L35 [candidate division WOR-1 bacterium RIFOXYB2_FULL_46_45]OGC31539.1 MAG: 50S ribosomal protein L35 [candidate division WOR-1 bacterium RIFOXYA2_FULL_46_56]OGC39946.1 MAG: 50S ribosomal protein L35 [candidate division WOR-1 bacterium RIFOXYC2_FULL_46_14]
MPKIKTRKAAAKRFKITGSGKIIARHSNSRHLLEWKGRKKKRQYKRGLLVHPTDIRRVKEMLPYG